MFINFQMFPPDQTAGPNGLKFFWTLMGGRGCHRLKIQSTKYFSFLVFNMINCLIN